MKTAVFVSCLLAAVGCGEGFTGPTTALNVDFVLGPRQVAAVDETSVRIRFDRVSNDSRCPADVLCVRAGEAFVHITVLSASAAREYELQTGKTRPAIHGDLAIHLVQLAPYPLSSRPIAPDEYRATLRVTR